MANPPDTEAPLLAADQLQAPLARLLRPLVRLLIRSGVTFPSLQDLLRQLYVNVAEYDFALPDKDQTDSRVSLLTGVHRKEVHRLRGAGAPVSRVPSAVSRASQIVARWLGAPGYQDEMGRPLPLPKSSSETQGVSFESLVESVTRDVRPRAVLDEWLRQGRVELDQDQRIVLLEAAFAPRGDGESLAYYFGRNLHDHIAASVANLSGAKGRFLERAVHYDGLTRAQAAELEAFARSLAMRTLKEANEKALSLVETPEQHLDIEDPVEEARDWRWNFGLYVYREKSEPGGLRE